MKLSDLSLLDPRIIDPPRVMSRTGCDSCPGFRDRKSPPGQSARDLRPDPAMTRLRKRRRAPGLRSCRSFVTGAHGRRRRTAAANRPSPLAAAFSISLERYTRASRIPHDGDRLLRMNPSTARSEVRNRRLNAAIFRVNRRPVAGCTSQIRPWFETMRIGARGTPSPIWVSGQTGINRTRDLSRLTAGQVMTRPS